MRSWNCSTTPKIDTTAPLPSTEVASYAPGEVPNCKRLHEAGREVRMGGWKRARVFNWELMFGISSLILAFMAVGALLVYESFMRAR
jgi:hypothetical protein